jgi:NADPH-dependent 2,4-dienoyl-CoA reductase/sulfur reductase-like enzyme
VVGGGLIGVELAEMLHCRGIGVTMLVREPRLWGNVLPEKEAGLLQRHIAGHGIVLRTGAELDALMDDGAGRVKEVRTTTGEVLPAGFVGIAIGVSPNIAFLRDSGIPTDRGVLVNEHLETAVPDVYAIGDCAQFHTHPAPGRKVVEQVWYTGRAMGETVARTITGERTPYRPGPWFNSAKFFDIEYQTYGEVHALPGDGEDRHYWEHADGRRCIHLVWERGTRRFKGVNALGIRLRHEMFDRWLRADATIDEVMSKLDQAHFDPEFNRHHLRDVGRSFHLRPA